MCARDAVKTVDGIDQDSDRTGRDTRVQGLPDIEEADEKARKPAVLDPVSGTGALSLGPDGSCVFF